MAIEVVNVSSIYDFIKTPLRVYPYKMVNVNGENEFLQENTTIILSIENSGTAKKIDENGFEYIEVIPQTTSSTGATNFNFSSFSQLFEVKSRIECASNDLPSGLTQKSVDLGSYKVVPYIFTIGKPYSYDEYINETQQVFIVDTQINIRDDDEENDDILINHGYQEATFINIKEVTKDFKNFNILPFTNYIYLKNPNVNGKSSFIVKLPFNGLLSYSQGLNVKVITTDKQIEDFDYSISNIGIAPFYFAPIDVTDKKVTVFAGWFDYDLIPPYNIAKYFLKNDTLRNIFNQYNKPYVDEDLMPLYAMLVISTSFANEFSQFPRITDRNQADYGKLDATKYVGSKLGESASNFLFNVGTLVNRSPSDVMTNIYQKWYRINSMQETDFRTQNMKQIIAMLSKYIGGRYAIGGDRDNNSVSGANAFNEVYMPWFLRLTSPVNLVKTTVKSPIIGDDNDVESFQKGTGILDFKIILQSRYFTQPNIEGKFTISKNDTLNKIRLIQSDRKLTLPTIPETIEAIDKLPLAGDIDTASSDDLKYFVAIPLNDDESLEKLLLYDSDKMPPQEVTFNTNWTDYGKELGDNNKIQKLIKDEASILYDVKVSDIEIISLGNIESNSDTFYPPEKLRRILTRGKSEGAFGCINTDNIVTNFDANKICDVDICSNPLTYCLESTPLKKIWTDEGIRNRRGWTQGTYSFIYNKSYGKQIENSNLPYCAFCNWIHYDYAVVVYRYRMVNIKLKINNFSKKLDRETIYSKTKFTRFLSSLRIYNSSEIEYHLVQNENSNDIEKIYSINFGSFWRDYATLIINGLSIKIPCQQKWDETYGRQNIIFI